MASEGELVKALYEQLTAAGVRAWYDKACLRPGQKWEDGFVDGMLQSVMIVPLLSRQQLGNFETLQADSKCDNVLLEHIMMLELFARNEIKAIFPVMVGERSGNRYASFFEGKAACELPSVRVEAVGEKLESHLKRAKKGAPISSAAISATVPQVLDSLLEYQGVAMASDDAAAVAAASQAVLAAVEDVHAGRKPQRRASRHTSGLRLKPPSFLVSRRSSEASTVPKQPEDRGVALVEGKGPLKMVSSEPSV